MTTAAGGRLRQFTALLLFAAVVALAAAGGVVTPPGEWYAALDKPPLTPPSWLFAPVWTALYLGVAVAGWLIWRRAGLAGGLPALSPWLAQLGANGLWSILFFGLQSPGLALIDLVLLWALILLTMLRFKRVSAPATWLMAPYLAWVSFAGYLNAAIWWLN